MANSDGDTQQTETRSHDRPDRPHRGPPTPEEPPTYIVGVGASAGGLEALRALFGRLGPIRRLAFVVVQHLAPQHRSRLVELVAHTTALPVREVTDGEAPRAGVIHITPPNANVVYEDGVLHLRDPAPKIGPKPSIDLFFSTLAQDAGDRAIGVILSGTGSDGAHGVRAVKAAGGLALCQTPESAKYDGMPRAALQTGAVDRRLSPEDLAEVLAEIDRRDGHRVAEIRQDEALVANGEEPYAQILHALERTTGVDFGDYKQSTIRRRIDRRLNATGARSLARYALYLNEHPEEARLLYSDILISVTAFFRDPEAFEALSRSIEERVRAKPEGQPFRCWVAGCATGEEPYSIAILVHEAIRRANRTQRVQVFTTDLDEHALLIARKATYSKASLVQLPARYTDTYFVPVDQRLQVVPEIRETVVFARHNLTEDPPFLGLDLVVCRNVLIYFASRLQERVLRTFHYSLETDGLLFLGKSEAASHPPECFEPVDKNRKIYRRTGTARSLPQLRTRRESQREGQLAARDREASRDSEVFHSLVQSIAPDSVLTDEDGYVRQVFGNAGEVLRLPAGAATMALQRLLPEELSVECSTLMHRASRKQRAVRGQRRELDLPSVGHTGLQLHVIPFAQDGRPQYLVAFERFEPSAATPEGQAPAPDEGAESAEDKIRRLEEELQAVREHLQNSTQEQETANEELQALNEELQSANEELQSSNEELETTNEELQSSNEELTTLNEELNVKSSELQSLNQRLEAIQGAIHYPLLIIDPDLRLQSYNPAARYLFRIGAADLGASLHTIPASVDLGALIGRIRQALEEGQDTDLSLESQGRYFEVKVQLFRNATARTVGAVLSFVDLTELKWALAEAQTKERQITAITNNSPALITMKDAQGVYTYVNPHFTVMTGRQAGDVLGHTDEEVFGPVQGGALREQDFEVLKRRRPLQQSERLEVDGEARWWLSSRFPLLDEQNKAYSLCTVALDVTERMRHERELELFRAALSAASEGIVLFHVEPEGDAFRAVYQSGELLAQRGLAAVAEQRASLAEVLTDLFRRSESVGGAELAAQILASRDQVFSAIHFLNGGGDDDRWIEVRAACAPTAEDGSRDLVLVLNDVTYQMRYEKALQEQKEALGRFSRLAALGELTSGIAHEINSPLNAIVTKTELLRRMTGSERPVDPERLDKVTGDIDRMVDTVGQVIAGLKAISRGDDQDRRRWVSLRALLDDARRVVGMAVRRHRIDLRVEAPATDVQVHCNPVQICQILVNLINNAVDAVAEQDEPWIRVVVTRQGDWLQLDVTDSGPGVPEAIAERIMTPHFTTKDWLRGTGLGLSLSRNLARRHDGDLALLRDAPNTTFRLRLPLAATNTDTEQETDS